MDKDQKFVIGFSAYQLDASLDFRLDFGAQARHIGKRYRAQATFPVHSTLGEVAAKLRRLADAIETELVEPAA